MSIFNNYCISFYCVISCGGSDDNNNNTTPTCRKKYCVTSRIELEKGNPDIFVSV